eukprot:178434_1
MAVNVIIRIRIESPVQNTHLLMATWNCRLTARAWRYLIGHNNDSILQFIAPFPFILTSRKMTNIHKVIPCSFTAQQRLILNAFINDWQHW